jgi:hypothetical protein
VDDPRHLLLINGSGVIVSATNFSAVTVTTSCVNSCISTLIAYDRRGGRQSQEAH